MSYPTLALAGGHSDQSLSAESLGKAPQSCRQCRRLKRKCARQVPSCSLCVRLGKRCQYPAGRKAYGSPLDDESQPTSGPSSISAVSSTMTTVSDFPPTFFLDSELFIPISHTALDGAYPVAAHISELLGPDPAAICEAYFSSVDTWFPFMSRKRLRQDLDARITAETSEMGLLLLCMRLVAENPAAVNIAAVDLPLYRAARGYADSVEITSPTSLRLFQSIVLIAVYEIGHGIFPTAYLTVGRAARLGLLRGIHDRKNATQLFQTPPTWTYWEEERRTWWAISILERYINLGPTNRPLSTPEPVHGELLPTSDTQWLRGEIGQSQPLYTRGFLIDSEIGPYARICQASHILGRVLHHRNSLKEHMVQESSLDEAVQLNATLDALDTHLSQPTIEPMTTADVALCVIARLTLYHGYACIQPTATTDRLAREIEMQNASIRGLKQIISTRGPMLASCVIQQAAESVNASSPLVIQCLYDIATECQWFLKEGDVVEGTATTLHLVTETLVLLSQRWSLANTCLVLLKKSENQ